MGVLRAFRNDVIMIDLHCHILPGVDDGPGTMEESLKMAREFEETGYSRVVATPHFIPKTYWTPHSEKVEEKTNLLNQILEKEGRALRLIPGMEIAMDPSIPELLDRGDVLTLAGTSYVLIEPPFQRLPIGWEEILFSVLASGYRILLAHPERCVHLINEPGLFDELVERGICLQVNWASFQGTYGSEFVRGASLLAKKGYIHCLATDSHTPHDPRGPDSISRARKRVQDLVGTKDLELISKENPARVLSGDPLVDVGIGKTARERKTHRLQRT